MWVREGSGGSGRVREGLEGPGRSGRILKGMRHEGSTLVWEGPEGLGGSGRILKGPLGSGRVWEDQGGSCRSRKGLEESRRVL